MRVRLPSFYLAATRAAPPPDRLPPELAADVRRAQEACARYAAQYKAYLREQLAAKGFDAGRSSARFAQCLDIVLGEKRIYVQEPRYYYFPGLPQIQFYADGMFPWLADVEAATDDIRSELLAVMREPGCVLALCDRTREPAAQRPAGHAQQPRLERLLPVEKRRSRSGQRRAMPARPCTRCATRRLHRCRIAHRPFSSRS